MIPFFVPDLPTFDSIEPRLRQSLESGILSGFGPMVVDLESDLMARLGQPVVTVSSGTAGLIIALQAMGLRRGEYVAVPGWTFIATAQAVVAAGGIPVFVDMNPDFTMSPFSVLEAADAYPIRIILPVHPHGIPADIKFIRLVAREHLGPGVRIIADAAQAFGSRQALSEADISVVSCSPTKSLAGPDGGFVTTIIPKLVEPLRAARNYGLGGSTPGINGRMNEWSAAVILANLRRFDEISARRIGLARRYREALTDRVPEVQTIHPRSDEIVLKDFNVLLPAGVDRSRLMRYLYDEHAVPTRHYFDPPLYRYVAFRGYPSASVALTEALAPRVLTLPFFSSMTESQVEQVVEGLRKCLTY